jgi:AcrR family transcriptional regulator
MPKHFSADEKDQIRETLLSVGLEFFEKFGISKTNVGDITDKAGISKGSFYAFFNSKGDLFMEIYRRQREKAHREVLAEVTNGESDLYTLILQYTNGILRRIKEQPILEIVYDPAALMMISDKSVRERLLSFNQEINKHITDMVETWMVRDGKYNIEPKIVAKMFRCVNFVRFHESAIGSEDFELVLETMTHAVVEYVQKQKIG